VLYHGNVVFQVLVLMAVNGDAFSMSAFSGRGNGSNWVEFCEHHATIAAEDFSLHVAQFVQDNLATERQPTRRDFVNKFVDCFQRHFESAQVWQLLADFFLLMPTTVVATGRWSITYILQSNDVGLLSVMCFNLLVNNCITKGPTTCFFKSLFLSHFL